MTHVGKKFALRLTGSLRLLLGLPEIAVGADQFGRPRHNLHLQTVLVIQQFTVPKFNFRQHFIECVDQLP